MTVAWVEENEENILAYARDPFQARDGLMLTSLGAS